MLADTIQTLLTRARATLNEQRFLHLLGVTHTVTMLAHIHGLGVEKAAVAGLLHDISKERKNRDLERELEEWGHPLAAEDREHPRTWHGMHAAVWAQRELDLDDPDIFEAVSLHTTADAGVGPLARALYIADFTEPLRRLAEAGDILKLARADLDAGFRLAMTTKFIHVRDKGKPVHPRSKRALLYFLPESRARDLLKIGKLYDARTV